VQLYESSARKGAGMRAKKKWKMIVAINLMLLREFFDLLEDPPLLEILLRVEVITRSSLDTIVAFVIGNQTNDKIVSPVTSPSITVQSAVREAYIFHNYANLSSLFFTESRPEAL